MRWFTFALVVSLAAGIGVLVGVLLAKPSETTLAVTTQPREDQIFIPPAAGVPDVPHQTPYGAALASLIS